MTIRVPDYFLSFKCIADKCEDSCCVGWEIDIDDDARAKYALAKGDIGEEIRRKTQHGCFPLTKNGACAFLDEKGLCRIISELGEGYLCDICREHPRYYGIGASGIEGGIGLACPEAARILLAVTEKPKFCEIEANPAYFSEDEYAKECEELRELIYNAIYSKSGPELIRAMTSLAEYANVLDFCICTEFDPPKLDLDESRKSTDQLIEQAFSVFEGCEALTEEWTERFERAKSTVDKEDILEAFAANEPKLRCLLFYFTHRYVRECIEELTTGEHVLFTLLASIVVFAIALTYEEPELERAAVLFSKNIEYSTDNTDCVLSKICVDL